jgi:hypothetical protein
MTTAAAVYAARYSAASSMGRSDVDQRDIDAFLAAKQQLRVGRWVRYLTVAMVVVAGGLCILGIGGPYSKGRSAATRMQ